MSELNSLNITDASNTARFPEGMAPSQVNNGARALEGMLARFDRDNDGSLTTGGTSTDFTLALNSQHSAWFSGLRFRANVHTNAGATPTINPTGSGALGAKSLYWADGTQVDSDLSSGLYDFVYLSSPDKVYVLALPPTTIAAASEGTAGKAELATQAETNTGTDDARIVTPLKLSTWSPAVATVSVASGDKVLIADSSDSGKIKQVDQAEFSASISVAILRDEKADGTAGGTATSGSRQDRDLNTEFVDVDGIVTVSSPNFTPISGTYLAIVSVPRYDVGALDVWLVNNTGPADVGRNSFGGAGTSEQNPIYCTSYFVFTANGTDSYKIQQQVTSTRATDGMGLAAGATSGVEIYTTVTLLKIG